MDKLYIGDIPLDYKYAVFGNGYITLYNQASASNETLNYYRIYTTNNGFYYSTGYQSFGSYNITTFQPLEVTNNYLYRTDIDGILLITFIFCLFCIFLINIMTSSIKKGGVFGGLL